VPRIPILKQEELTPEQCRVYEAIVGTRRGKLPAPYQLTLHCPEFTDRWQRVGSWLRSETGLLPTLCELAILITARHWDCQYVWHAHAPHALDAGLPSTVVDAIRNGQRPTFSDSKQEAVYDYCSELLETRCVSDSSYRCTLGMFGTTGTVALTGLVGYYVMVAMALNAHQYPLPEGISPPLPVR